MKEKDICFFNIDPRQVRKPTDAQRWQGEDALVPDTRREWLHGDEDKRRLRKLSREMKEQLELKKRAKDKQHGVEKENAEKVLD